MKLTNQILIYLVRDRKPSFSVPFIAGETGIKEQRIKNMVRTDPASRTEGNEYELKILLEKFHSFLPLDRPGWERVKTMIPQQSKMQPDITAEMIEQVELLDKRVWELQDRIRELEDKNRELLIKLAKKNLTTVRIN